MRLADGWDGETGQGCHRVDGAQKRRWQSTRTRDTKGGIGDAGGSGGLVIKNGMLEGYGILRDGTAVCLERPMSRSLECQVRQLSSLQAVKR